MRTFLLLILALVLAGLVYLIIPSGGSVMTEAADEESVEEEERGFAGEVDVPVEAKPAEERKLLSAEPHRLRGRLLRAEDGEPLVGARVLISAIAPEDGANLWEDQPAQFSGEDGSFEVTYPLHDGHRYEFSIRCEGRAWLGARFTAGQLPTDQNFGDVRVPAGIKVSGRVIDEVGNGLPGYAVNLSRMPLVAGGAPPRGDETWSLPRPLRVALSYRAHGGAQGSFEFVYPFPPGSWLVNRVRGRGFVGPLEPVELLAGEDAKVIEVVWAGDRLRNAILGTIVDEAGQPVPAARVSAYGGGVLARGQTWADGSFVLSPELELGESAPAGEVFVMADFENFEYESLNQEGPFHWGDRGVTLQTRRNVMGGLELQVFSADSGMPVERYSVRHFKDIRGTRGGQTGDQSIRHLGHHDDGVLALPRLRRGKHLLSVFPVDADHMSVIDQPVEIAANQTERLRIELRKGVLLKVSVRYSDGRPVAGSLVELLRRSDYDSAPKIDVGSLAVPPEEMYVLASGPSIAWQLATARSDPEGVAELRALPSPEPYVLRLMGPGHEPMVYGEVMVDEQDRSLDVIVHAGATLEGLIMPPEFVAQFVLEDGEVKPGPVGSFHGPLTISLTEVADDPRRLPGVGNVWFVSDDGRFELPNLPAGTWRVSIQGRRQARSGSTTSTGFPPAATVELRSGVTTRIQINARDFEPGAIRGLITRDGEPLKNAEIVLWRAHLDGSGGLRRSGLISGVRTDDQGRFMQTGLAPAHYLVELRAERQTLVLTDWFKLPPGQELSQVIEIVNPRVRLRLTGKGGSVPLAGAALLLDQVDGRGSVYEVTDDSGWVEIDPAPTGELSVRVQPTNWPEASKRMDIEEWNAGIVTLAPIRVTATPAEQVFHLKLPPGK
ncbi:MAG: hypothetical protein ACYTG5_03065 [Planctomycetota bacterium]|jgi:protocatechuate 3,4-dioxygenase beta subunit